MLSSDFLSFTSADSLAHMLVLVFHNLLGFVMFVQCLHSENKNFQTLTDRMMLYLQK